MVLMVYGHPGPPSLNLPNLILVQPYRRVCDHELQIVYTWVPEAWMEIANIPNLVTMWHVSVEYRAIDPD